jgi:hypothetical protein
VRALISRARAATSVRVSPSARNFWNAGERCSAPTNDHQLWSSHWPRRRSSQLVSRVSEQHLLGADEVTVDADAAHRVRHVAVEAGEEAEAVLGRQVAAAVGPRARDGQAARLAAETVARLVDGDREPALGELVCGGETRHATTQDRDRRRHRRASLTSLRGCDHRVS